MSAAAGQRRENDRERRRLGRAGVGARRVRARETFTPASAARPAISSPTLSSSAFSWGRSARMRPSNMTSTRSESARISLKLRRDQEHRAAVVALGDEPLMDIFGRADVEPARRLLRDQHRRLVRQLARNHNLLQVASRERSDIHALVCDADREALE